MSRSWILLDPGRYRVMPWKNGGGTTAEVAVHAEAQPTAAPARFLWRISVATIDRDGPFSDFAGYRRTIMPIEGKGMVLDFGRHGCERLDRLFEPFDFPGEWSAACRLIDGPCRDFNVMVDRERCGVAARVVKVGAVPTTPREGAPLGRIGFSAAPKTPEHDPSVRSRSETVTVVSSGMTTILFVLAGDVLAEAAPWLPPTRLGRHHALRIDAAKDDDSPLPVALTAAGVPGSDATIYQIDLRWT